MLGADGALYGITQGGGNGLTHLGAHTNAGTVFKVNTNGSGYQVLHDFDTLDPNDGLPSPIGLVQGTNGVLYGTMVGPPGHPYLSSYGYIFKINTNGGGYGTVRAQVESSAPLALGRDGLLYGTGNINYTNALVGGVFRVKTDGSDLLLLHQFVDNFPNPPTDGALPVAPLMQISDGTIYGTTTRGGYLTDNGTVFKVNPDGTGYALVYSFNPTNTANHGGGPNGALVQGSDGALYGTTPGNVFKINPDGSGYSVIWNFGSVPLDGISGYAGLTLGGDGTFYGTTLFGGNNGAGTVFTLVFPPAGFGYATLNNFGSNGSDGASPSSLLIQGRDGALYGTTFQGGSHNVGTVFKENVDGTGYMRLHSFGTNAGEGSTPFTGLIQGADGALYGVTSFGGNGVTGSPLFPSGNGTVYRLNTYGTSYSVLYSFNGGGDGVAPGSVLAQASDGMLYGTSQGGGINNFGTVFKLNTNGGPDVVRYNFGAGGTNDGQDPTGLILGMDRLLYGTTFVGGTNYGNSFFGGTNGAGTVFKMNLNGTGYAQLHSFGSGSDGQNPAVAPIQGSDGMLYGTTLVGGSNNVGTVFKISTNATDYAVLYNFKTNGLDGIYPNEVIQGSDGALYGTTEMGGYGGGYGTVFTLNTDGSGYAVIYNFGIGSDGRSPSAGLLQGADGLFYGTTSGGGSNNLGTVFRLGTPFSLTSFALLPNKTFEVSFSANSNANYRVDAATNLTDWVTLANISNASGTVQFIDTNAPNFFRRFYRAVRTSVAH